MNISERKGQVSRIDFLDKRVLTLIELSERILEKLTEMDRFILGAMNPMETPVNMPADTEAKPDSWLELLEGRLENIFGNLDRTLSLLTRLEELGFAGYVQQGKHQYEKPRMD